jgi:hypothetical protein
MIRKQLYLEEAQDRALKQRSEELGISEAEFVRRALDAALRPPGNTHPTAPRRAALTRLLENAKRLSKGHTFPEGYRFNREELYNEQEGRWLKRR